DGARKARRTISAGSANRAGRSSTTPASSWWTSVPRSKPPSRSFPPTPTSVPAGSVERSWSLAEAGRVPTIDLHTHILPESWPNLRERYGYGGFVQLERISPCRAKMVIDGRSFREIDD